MEQGGDWPGVGQGSELRPWSGWGGRGSARRRVHRHVGLVAAGLRVEDAAASDSATGRRRETRGASDQGPADPRLRTSPVMGRLRFIDPDEPKNAALPKVKIPPSLATSQ
jgi:hypothetical protein